MLRRELSLPADFRKDLHNFVFLGRSARIGTASDWVWYNVPHGPQKQVESFFQGQRCIREGREQVGRLPCASTPQDQSLERQGSAEHVLGMNYTEAAWAHGHRMQDAMPSSRLALQMRC